jgi:hypothetical protein
MSNLSFHRDDAELRKLDHHKRIQRQAGEALGPEMISFFRQSVEKRHSKLGKIAECWGRLIPETLSEHCSLESYHRGTLTVIVDSSSHLYELKQLLLAGLQQQLLLACKSAGLRKINLRAGRWYDSVDDGGRKLRFDR